MLKPGDPKWQWGHQGEESRSSQEDSVPRQDPGTLLHHFFLSVRKFQVPQGGEKETLNNVVRAVTPPMTGREWGHTRPIWKAKNFSPVNRWSIPELQRKILELTPGVCCVSSHSLLELLCCCLCCNKWDSAVTKPLKLKLKLKLKISDRGGFPGPRADEEDFGIGNPPPTHFPAVTDFCLGWSRFLCQFLRNYDNPQGPCSCSSQAPGLWIIQWGESFAWGNFQQGLSQGNDESPAQLFLLGPGRRMRMCLELLLLGIVLPVLWHHPD